MTMARSIRKFTQTVDLSALPFNRLRKHRYFPLTVVVAGVLLLGCLHIWQRVQVMTLVHETALLREKNRQLNQIELRLDDEVARLSVAGRIETYAADTLGLERVPATRLFTMVRKHESVEPADRLSQVFSSIKRVAEHLPVVSETQAQAGEAPILILDDTIGEGN